MTTRKSLCEWEDMFNFADKDNSGSLDMSELTDLLKHGNCNVTGSQIADTFVYFDGHDGDKKITLEEFVKGMQNFQCFFIQLCDLFKEHDADSSGYLEKAELRQLLSSCGHKFTDAEVDQILKQADKSGDGKISFQEFLEACT